MPKRVTTTSASGYVSTSTIREFSVEIDATGESAPDTLESLLATYASCYVPALRVGGEQRGTGDLGEVTFEVTGELNDDDKLEAIHFDITTAASLDRDSATAVIERANALCKVHDALKESVRASITVDGHAM